MWNIYYIMVQGYVIRMELMVDLTENKSASMHSPQCFQLLWGGSACRDSFTRICNLIFPRSLREGVNVLGWLVAIPHPLREREQSCSSRQAKATNAGVGVTQEHLQSAPLCEGKLFSDTLPLCSRYRFENLPLAPFRLNLTSVTLPRPLREREQLFLSREAKVTDAGEGLNIILTITHPNLPSREGTCAVAQLTPMPLDYLITWSLDHCPQKEVLS